MTCIDLSANGYPQKVVLAVLEKNKRPSRPETKGGEDAANLITASLPYVSGLSEAIRRILATVGIRTAMKTMDIKWQLMKRAKDAIPANRVPGVVYAIGCKECPQVYIGETKRTAQQRAKEHNAHARLGHPDLSAVAAHCLTTSHAIHWEPMVVVREQSMLKRKVREALAIHQLNRKDQMMNADRGMSLSKLWLDLV